MSKEDHLMMLLVAAGIVGVSFNGSGPALTMSFLAETTQGQKDSAAAILAAFDWSDAAHAVWLNQLLRDQAIAIFDGMDGAAKISRAITYSIVSELNAIRQWLVAFKTATAASTNYATLKTGVAGLSGMPDRTDAQARTVIVNKVAADA